MSTVETPPPAPATAQRHCPRCGAAMTDEQEWCLRCGAAVGTRVMAARGWRAPLLVTGLILLLAAIAVAVAIIQLADDTNQVNQPVASATPTPTVDPAAVPGATPDPGLTPPTTTVTPEPTPSITPAPTTTPEATATPDATATGSISEWPAGEEGWTVVLASTSSEDSARDRAEGFQGQGIADVGVLDSDDFGSLKAGFWVVYSGEFDSQSDAADALDGIDAQDAYIRRIAPS